MLGTYFTAIFGLSASAFIYWIGPRIYVHTRINPIKRDSLVAFTLCYSALITFFFDVCAYMSSGGSSTAGSLTLCALIWSPIFYHRNKKKLMRTRLLILPEPVPPLQWVPKQQPGNAEEAPPPADKQEEPEQPARPKIVTPVKLGSQPATSVAPCVAEAPQPLIVRKSSIWLKSFAVVMTVLFAAVMVYAVYLNFELENTQGELNKTNWLYKSLKPKYDTLKTDYNTIKEKYDNLRDMSSQTLEDYGRAITKLSNIGYIWDGYKNYHRYDCILVEDAKTYWAHNVEYCESIGYAPCPHCWED